MKDAFPPARTTIAVLGGGPAGSLAASLLARKGHDVVLLERARHPRPQVGESVLPHAWKYLDMAGARAAIEGGGFVVKAGGTVAWGGRIRQMSFSEFGFTRPALHVERDRFDQLLFEHARTSGARTFENTSVEACERLDEDGARLRWRHADGRVGTIDCAVAIDATGQRALLARHLGLRESETSHRMIAAWGYYQCSRYVDAAGRAREFRELVSVPPTTCVASVGTRGGWSWHIPLNRTTSVGLVLPAGALALEAAGLDRDFDRACRAEPILGKLLEPASLEPGSVAVVRDYSYRATRYAGRSWFLAGDAAAFVDPIFSLGVTFALYSGAMAAWAADRGIARPARRDGAAELYHGQLSRRVELARAMALPCYEPGGEAAAALATQLLPLESATERSLLESAASLTDRARTVAGLSGEPVPLRYRELAAIAYE